MCKASLLKKLNALWKLTILSYPLVLKSFKKNLRKLVKINLTKKPHLAALQIFTTFFLKLDKKISVRTSR